MTKSVIFLISLSLLYHVHAQDAAQPAAEDCDPDWKSLSNGCYFTELKKMNWQAAKDYCTEKKAKMVVVENKEIQAEIASGAMEILTGGVTIVQKTNVVGDLLSTLFVS